MYKKVDKFAIFSQKFAKLNNEGQDKLVKTAYKLLQVHRCVKDTSPPLSNIDTKMHFMHDGFNTETE